MDSLSGSNVTSSFWKTYWPKESHVWGLQPFSLMSSERESGLGLPGLSFSSNKLSEERGTAMCKF